MRKTLLSEETEDNIFEKLKETLKHIKDSITIEDKFAKLPISKILELDFEICERILNDPEKTIELVEKALNSLFVQELKVIFTDIPDKIEIGKIRTQNLGHLHGLKGIIKRITKVIPRIVNIKFECPSCGTIIGIEQNKKLKSTPKRCRCGYTKEFKAVHEEFKNIQEINLEEIQEDIEGRQPHQIRVYLEDFLTDSTLTNRLQPGKKVEVIGVIKKLPAFMTQKDEDLNLSEFMIYANNIIPSDKEDTEISEEDEKQIREIAALNPLERLSKSLAPEVYGNDTVKKAVVLQMIKGVARERSDRSMSRAELHILICGDVGTGKSILLKSTIAKTPRAKMIIGTRTSRTALGAMCVKDELLNVWSLESGAIVLANNSTIGIDEIDKLNKENISELLEPMSSGSVSLNKAGISATLPAKTCILAAANPIYGNYNLNQPLAKQIDLPTPILNRFDLVFVLVDKPNAEFDAQSMEYVFNSLKEKRATEISPELFKKYISYCRKLTPRLDDEICENIKNFYVNLRQQSLIGKELKGLPLNLRNMEGIIKMSEAHAKLRLSEKVEIDDLKVAKEIFMFCLKQVGMDNETGLMDLSRLTEKVPISKKGQVELLFSIIQRLRERLGNLLPYEEIQKEAELSGIKKWEIYDYLDLLKREGKIYEPQKGNYSIL